MQYSVETQSHIFREILTTMRLLKEGEDLLIRHGMFVPAMHLGTSRKTMPDLAFKRGEISESQCKRAKGII
jgi:hypothetical protein